jgi:hypothetical protein
MHPIVASDTPISTFFNEVEPSTNTGGTERKVDMVRVTTKCGASIVVAPESLFGLKNVDGNPVIRLAMRLKPMAPINFNDPLADEFDPSDRRYWYICGMTVSAGTIPTELSHASRISIDEDRAWELEILANFLRAYYDKYDRPNLKVKRNVSITSVKTTYLGVTLASKPINAIMARLAATIPEWGSSTWGNEICDATKDQQLNFLRNMYHADRYSAFMAGLLAGMKITPEGRLLRYKDRRFVHIVHDRLRDSFGVPTKITDHPYQPDVLALVRSGFYAHELLLPRAHYLKAQAASLAHWDNDLLNCGGEQSPLDIFPDEIASIEPVGRRTAMHVISRAPEVTLGNFVFKREFEPNDAAIEISTMPELWTEPQTKSILRER